MTDHAREAAEKIYYTVFSKDDEWKDKIPVFESVIQAAIDAACEEREFNRGHHLLCSMTSHHVDECSCCQRLFKQQEIEDEASRICVEYCATTRQAITRIVRESAKKAWATMKPKADAELNAAKQVCGFSLGD